MSILVQFFKSLWRSPDKNWHLVRQILETLSWVAIIVGVFIAVEQLSDSVRAERVSAALSYVTRFDEGSIVESKQRLSRYLAPHLVYISEINESGGLTAIQRRSIIRVIFEDALRNSDNLQADIVNLADFIDQIFLCVEMKTCDREIVDQYFGDYAFRFVCLFDEEIVRARQFLNDENLGEGLFYFFGNRNC